MITITFVGPAKGELQKAGSLGKLAFFAARSPLTVQSSDARRVETSAR
jgi:hypothetical protein